MHADVVFVGNPNVGKSALINLLSGSDLKTGNFLGTTVEKKSARVHLEGKTLELTDLPGVYSLAGHREDEVVTISRLGQTRPDLIVNVVDSTNLRRNLLLTAELMALGRPLLVVLNFADSLQKADVLIDTAALSQRLGVPVITAAAVRRESRGPVLQAIEAALNLPTPVDTAPEEKPADFARRMTEGIQTAPASHRRISDRIDRFALHPVLGPVLFVLTLYLVFKTTFDLSDPFIDWAEGLVREGLGSLLSNALLALAVPTWLYALVMDGIVAGVGLVVSFVPLLFLLYFFVAVLEQSGYLTRAAFLIDSLMRRMGLNGRAFVPMLIGFGCNVPAVAALRSLDDEAEKKAVAAVLPFMSCGAKMPIYALFTALFFEKHGGLVILLLYLTGLLTAMLWLLIQRPAGLVRPLVMEMPPYRMPAWRFLFRSVRARVRAFLFNAGTVITLSMIVMWALLHLPFQASPENTVMGRAARTAAPLFKPLGWGEDWRPAAAVISGFGAKEVVVGALGQLYRVESGEKSAEAEVTAESLSLFGYAAALPSVAIEGALSVLSGWVPSVFVVESEAGYLAEPLKESFTPKSALSFMVFNLLLMPCVAMMGVLRSMFGMRFVWQVLGQTVLTAYLAALVVYQVSTILL